MSAHTLKRPRGGRRAPARVLHVFTVSERDQVFWVHDGAAKFTVEALTGRCGCRQTGCAHLRAVERRLGQRLPLGRMLRCPLCDGEGRYDPERPGRPGKLACQVCSQTGRLIEAEARAMAHLVRPGPTAARMQKLWKLLGGQGEEPLQAERRASEQWLKENEALLDRLRGRMDGDGRAAA